jgi:hypothetical protein
VLAAAAGTPRLTSTAIGKLTKLTRLLLPKQRRLCQVVTTAARLMHRTNKCKTPQTGNLATVCQQRSVNPQPRQHTAHGIHHSTAPPTLAWQLQTTQPYNRQAMHQPYNQIQKQQQPTSVLPDCMAALQQSTPSHSMPGFCTRKAAAHTCHAAAYLPVAPTHKPNSACWAHNTTHNNRF